MDHFNQIAYQGSHRFGFFKMVDEDQTVHFQLLAEIGQTVSKSDVLQQPMVKDTETYAPAF